METITKIFQPKVIVLDLLAGGTCHLGDGFLQLQLVSNSALSRAAVDSFTHGLVGLLCWSSIIDLDLNWRSVLEAFLCMVLAMIVDIDHFIAAKSLKLQNALNLHHRPPFHNSSLILPMFVALMIIRFIIFHAFHVVKLPESFHILIQDLPWIFLVAWSTHHVRDATRRGLWFAPFGSKRPLAKWIYIGTILAIPLCLRIAFVIGEFCSRKSERENDKSNLFDV